jgi:hypothetical protein
MSKLQVHQGRHHDGACQGCQESANVFVITTNTWITRLCVACLKDVMRLAGMYKRDLKTHQ